MSIVIVFLVLLMAIFVYAHFLPQPPTESQRIMRRMSAEFSELAALLGAELLPAVQTASDAIADLGKQLREFEDPPGKPPENS